MICLEAMENDFKEIEPILKKEFIMAYPVKIEQVVPEWLEVAKKYECQTCKGNLISNIASVKCMNCKMDFQCEECFYLKRPQYCRLCNIDVSVPERLSAMEKKELGSIVIICHNRDRGCNVKLAYNYYYDHCYGACEFFKHREIADVIKKLSYLSRYKNSDSLRRTMKINNSEIIDLIKLDDHLKDPNPATMRYNWEIRDQKDIYISTAMPGFEKLADKYKCIGCKYRFFLKPEISVMPKNEIRKCACSMAFFCLTCYYRRSLSDCPNCNNYIFEPMYLSKEEMDDLRRMRFKCEKYDIGCDVNDNIFNLPIHSRKCDIWKKERLPISNFDKSTNDRSFKLIGIKTERKEISEDYVNNKEKEEIPNQNNFNIPDNKLFAIFDKGLRNLTVQKLKGLINHRNLSAGTANKSELVDIIISYMKEKYSKKFIISLIDNKTLENKYEIDEIKGLMKLLLLENLIKDSYTKQDLIKELKTYLNNYPS